MEKASVASADYVKYYKWVYVTLAAWHITKTLAENDYEQR